MLMLLVGEGAAPQAVAGDRCLIVSACIHIQWGQDLWCV
jgi:hypothetical protein